jgi:hypothetical protein
VSGRSQRPRRSDRTDANRDCGSGAADARAGQKIKAGAAELGADLKEGAKQINDSDAAQRIGDGAREAGRGVQQGAGEVVEAAGDKLKTAGQDVQKAAKPDVPPAKTTT